MLMKIESLNKKRPVLKADIETFLSPYRLRIEEDRIISLSDGLHLETIIWLRIVDKTTKRPINQQSRIPIMLMNEFNLHRIVVNGFDYTADC